MMQVKLSDVNEIVNTPLFLEKFTHRPHEFIVKEKNCPSDYGATISTFDRIYTVEVNSSFDDELLSREAKSINGITIPRELTLHAILAHELRHVQQMQQGILIGSQLEVVWSGPLYCSPMMYVAVKDEVGKTTYFYDKMMLNVNALFFPENVFKLPWEHEAMESIREVMIAMGVPQ